MLYSFRYHVHCGTARFALSCSLHRIASNNLDEQSEDHLQSHIGYLLLAPRTGVELGDRLNAFWQIYWSDKLFSTLMGFVPALPGPAESTDAITTVFPEEIEYYEVYVARVPDLQKLTIAHSLLQENAHNSRNNSIKDLLIPRATQDIVNAGQSDSTFGLALKALTLLEQAHKISTMHQDRTYTVICTA